LGLFDESKSPNGMLSVVGCIVCCVRLSGSEEVSSVVADGSICCGSTLSSIAGKICNESFGGRS
jgi:hypothetical protein